MALDALRIGCVRYLNAVPLIHGYRGPIVFEHPAELARALRDGRLDVALAPIYETLGERQYLVVDDVAIASHGAVFSVFLAYRNDLREVRRIAIDPASLTSVYLLKVLLAEFHDLHPLFIETADHDERVDAILLIGNQAIDFRHEHQSTHRFLDLGAEWSRCTALPFVYAVWMLRPELADPVAVAEALRALKRTGLASLDEVLDRQTFHERQFRARYLGEYIHYDLGELEKRGIEKFRELLIKHRLARAANRPLQYV